MNQTTSNKLWQKDLIIFELYYMLLSALAERKDLQMKLQEMDESWSVYPYFHPN